MTALDDARTLLAVVCRRPLPAGAGISLNVVRGALLFYRGQCVAGEPVPGFEPSGPTPSLLTRCEGCIKQLLSRPENNIPQTKMLRGCLKRVADVRKRLETTSSLGAVAAAFDCRAAQLPTGDRV
jgi:hypothetical protein